MNPHFDESSQVINIEYSESRREAAFKKVARCGTSGSKFSQQSRIEDAPRLMPSTHISLHSHLVFSTKDRVPSISADWRDRAHAYLGGIVKGLEAVPLVIGGTDDHVHLLVGFKSSHRIDYFVRDLKADSSEWIHKEIGTRGFSWQKGYAAFSVSPSGLLRVQSYIENQERHHRRVTFQDEYLSLLKSSGIEYDERYVW